MPELSARGLRFHYQELGEGPAVAMVHGLLVDNLSLWYFTAAPVLARRHRVLLYDLRGHGRSERARSGYSLASHRQDLEALLEARGIGDVALVGHSWGALVALSFAMRHPDLVRRLVLVEAPLPPSDLDQLEELQSIGAGDVLAAFPPALRAALVRGRRRGRRLVEALRFLLTECSLSQDVAAEPDLDDAELAAVRCPVLCLYGKDSGCLAAARRLERVLPEARLELLDGRHYLPLDAGEAMTARIAEFLAADLAGARDRGAG